jgi:hypothetical protein
VKSEPSPPMTLGGAAADRVRLIVWCKVCQHQVEPDPAEMAARQPQCSIGAPGGARAENGPAAKLTPHQALSRRNGRLFTP